MKNIQLTNEFDVGDFGSENFTHVRVERVNLDLVNKRILVELAMGYFDVDSNWVPAKKVPGVTSKFVTYMVDDLADLLVDAKTLVDGIVQKLVDDAEFDGTVV